jgi:hypothetical protein
MVESCLEDHAIHVARASSFKFLLLEACPKRNVPYVAIGANYDVVLFSSWFKQRDNTTSWRLRAGSDYAQVERRSVTFLDQTMSRGEAFGLNIYIKIIHCQFLNILI